ncbi:MAG: hypothetical protein GX445_03090 [Elusimicrobia bacterium]|nr:hypothetical protein [Elusimicrobiota bacterium]
MASVDIADETIAVGDMGANSVGTTQIINSTISLADMGQNSVGSYQIIDSTITSADIALNTIVADDIATNGVGSSEIADDAVTAAKILQGTAGQILMTNATPDTAWVSISGDATISGAGTLTLASVGTAGTYRSVTIDAKGRVTAGTNPTTFTGYGISDTSAGLATVITDKTGTGALVFGTNPTFTTSIITPKVQYTGANIYISSASTAQYGGIYVSTHIYLPSGAKYYGDGTNLTGVSASGVLNTGDVIINADSDVNDTGAVILRSGGTDILYVSTDNNVGIGTTGYTNAKLGVAGEVTATLGTYYGQFRLVAGDYGIILRNDGIDTYLLNTNSGNQYGVWNGLRPLKINNAGGHVTLGNGALYVQHGGNVGIGTTNPGAKLDVQGGNLRVGSPPFGAYDIFGRLGSFDTRSVNSTPQEYRMGIVPEFKYNTTDGLSDGGTYHGILTYRQWNDWTGGGVRQIGFTDNNNLWIRGANADTTWSSWQRILDTDSTVKTSGVLQIDGTGNSYIQGNVGIGRADPSYLLDVNGTSRFSGTMTLPGVGTNDIQNGTGDQATYSTYNFAIRGWWGVALKDYSNTVHGVYDFRTGNFTTDGVLNFRGSGNNYLAGNVGIGTTGPTHKLRVEGGILATSSITANGGFYGDGSGLINVNGSPVGSTLASGNIWVGNALSQAVEVSMGGDASLSNTGVLTIADDSHDHNDATISDNLTITAGDLSASQVIDDSHNHGDSTISDNISISNTRLYAPAGAGNVGIGTTSPGVKLDVVGDIRMSGQPIWGNGSSNTLFQDDITIRVPRSGFYETSSATTSEGWPENTNSWYFLLNNQHSNTTNNYAMQFAGNFYTQNLFYRSTNGSGITGWNRVLMENSSGNVGIGTTSPVAKLDVAGDLRGTGNLYLNNISPTVYFQDTNHYSGMIHVNDNLMYILSGSGINSTSWAMHGSYWPLTVNMTNDAFTFGGEAYFMEGNVGIGTTSPGYKLTISNGGIGGNYALLPNYANWGSYGTGDGGAAIYNDSNNYKKLMIVGNNSNGGAREIGMWDNVNIYGNLTVSGSIIGTITNADMIDGYHYSSSWPNPGDMVTGSGTANYIPKWTGTYTQGNSIIFDNGTNVGIGTTSPGYKLDVQGNTNINGKIYTATNIPKATNYMKIIRVASKGLSSSQGDYGVWIDGVKIFTPGRSYGLVVIRRSDGVVVYQNTFDVFGNANEATNLANQMASYNSDYIVIVLTYDEPQQNRIYGGLQDQIKRCGGTAGVFESANFQSRSAYLLIGICDMGPGTGREMYSGDASSDTTAFTDRTFLLADGNIIG